MAYLAEECEARQAAQADLRQMALMRVVIAASLSDKNEGLYRSVEHDLMIAAGLVEKEQRDPRQAVSTLAKRLNAAKTVREAQNKKPTG